MTRENDEQDRVEQIINTIPNDYWVTAKEIAELGLGDYPDFTYSNISSSAPLAWSEGPAMRQRRPHSNGEFEYRIPSNRKLNPPSRYRDGKKTESYHILLTLYEMNAVYRYVTIEGTRYNVNKDVEINEEIVHEGTGESITAMTGAEVAQLLANYGVDFSRERCQKLCSTLFKRGMLDRRMRFDDMGNPFEYFMNGPACEWFEDKRDVLEDW